MTTQTLPPANPAPPQEKQLITADDLIAMGDTGRCELIYGELVMMAPAGGAHGEIALRIGSFLFQFVEDHGLGRTFGAETGFLLDNDLVRAPDASFVRNDRLPKSVPIGFIEGPPDLAVEVTSPGDTPRYIREKVNTWLVKGTTSVWVLDPSSKTVAIHRMGKSFKLKGDQSIEDEPALPGFAITLKKIFRSR